MEQLELELGLQPVQKWLHVWEEKSRQELRGKDRITPVGEEAKEAIKPQPSTATRQAGSGKCRA